jgi:hypothetical protein
MDPETCAECHADHVRDWSGSMHAYAAEDPVFLAMNARGQRETDGALGDFCVRCHAPMAVLTGATTDGLNLSDVATPLQGVTCYFCHSVAEVGGEHNNPLVLSEDLVMRGPFADAVSNEAHASSYSKLHDRDDLASASLCGPCHDIENGHGVSLERTFAEWRASVFAQTPGGATCGQCHMRQSQNLVPVAQSAGVFARRYHDHSFPGVDVALTPFPEAEAQREKIQAELEDTLQTALCVSQFGSIQVIADAVGAGHSWPTGSAQDRRAWFEVIAYAGDEVVYQSGVVADGEALVDTVDPDRWLLRDCLFDDNDHLVHMFWDAKSYESHLLPAQVTFDALDPRYYQTHVYRSFPRAGLLGEIPDRVTMRVRIQPIGLDVLDDLIESGDLAAEHRAAMPTFDVGPTVEWTADTAVLGYVDDGLPFTCVSANGLNFQADKVLAPERDRCPP